MDQANDNIKVNINSLVNSIILQAIINSGSQSLLYGEGNTKPPPEDIEKMLENLSAIGLDDSQLPFPDPKENSNGLSLSPVNDFLQTFQYFKEEVIQSLGIGSCWINQLGTTCDDPEVREFITALGVPANHKVYGCVALGYPDSKIPMKEKKVKANTITIVR